MAKARVTSKRSVKYLLRLPQSLHLALVEAAIRDGVSLNTYIVMLLAKESKK